MADIFALLQPIQNSVSKTTLRQLSRIVVAMLAMTGRVTMLGLSRWTEKGGSYRTVQRFFYTIIPWAQVFWTFFRERLLNRQDTYLLAGDECVVTKAGKQTYGLDYFFSSLRQKAVPGLSFFTLSLLVSIKQRRSYPICVEQMIRTEEEKAASKAKKEAKKAKPAHPKRKPGRPKGSRNKNKADVILNPELQRIQKMLRSFLNTIQGTLQLTCLVLDGHFGNHPAFHMVRQCQLHLISKLRYDAALHFAFADPSPKRGPTPRLGEQVDVRKIPDQYLKETHIEDGLETRTYQMQLLHKDFPHPWNVVIFKDAKQFWGLEDFMNVTPTAVTNAANLALCMTDVSQVLMCQYRQDDPNFSVLDLKADYRSYRYVTETIQMLPQKPDDNLVSQLFHKVAALGRIHPVKTRFLQVNWRRY